MSNTLKKWSGSSIEEIISRITPESIRQAPKIEVSDCHTVLFNLPLPNDDNEMPIPLESEDRDKWDDIHVKLPCSSHSLYLEINEEGEKIKKSRWELIKTSLKNQEITNSRALEKAIKVYNNKYENSWNFSTLHELFEDEFDEEDTKLIFNDLIPKMIDLALDLPNLIKSPIPLLKQKANHSISLSQQQIASLLANAFFCTFPNRAKRDSDFPEINFNRLFASQGRHVMNKIKCILRYFLTILTNPSAHTGVLTFQRRYIEPNEFPKWESLDKKISTIKWHVCSNGTIEEGHRMLQVDFANRYLGGGVLGSGCVQEEIRFMINPECIVGMLFCESMKKEEAIYIYGSKQFSKYKGYARSFEWEGDCKIVNYEYDEYRRNLLHIVAIDALAFHKPTQQFKEFLIARELNKAYCGFYNDDSNSHPIPIATGNWGCGAFRGYNRLKCLIQLMACVANGRDLVYYTFNDFGLMLEMEEMIQFLQENEVTVAQLWRYLTSFKNIENFDLLYHHIYDQYKADKELEGLDLRDFSEVENTEICNENPQINTEETNKVNEEFLENPSKKLKLSVGDSNDELLNNPKNELTSNENDDESLEVPTKTLKICDEQPKENNSLKKITDFFQKK